ncbi:MAG TPA: DUF5017 domain-containing protein, partial [Sphingobacteriaceae bacterium]
MKTKYYFLLPCLLLFFACSKDLDVDVPSFDITGYEVSDGVDSAGNAVKKVEFNLQGNADVISFYSGEILHNYAFRDGRILKTNDLKMSFTYNGQLGLGTIIRENQLSVVASTDYDGTAVEAATWKNITSRFSLRLVKDIPDGEYITTNASIADLVIEGKPLYIAFKYDTPAQTTALRYSRWQIRDFKISQETDIGNTVLVDQSATPLTLYHTGPVESGRTSSNSTQVQFRGNNRSTNFAFPTEDWAISPIITVADDLDLGPDRPLAIKSRIDPALNTYTYNYTKPGVYKVAFVASNVTTEGEQKIVKEMEV